MPDLFGGQEEPEKKKVKTHDFTTSGPDGSVGMVRWEDHDDPNNKNAVLSGFGKIKAGDEILILLRNVSARFKVKKVKYNGEMFVAECVLSEKEK